MSGYANNGTTIGRIATWFLIGIVALIALKLLGAIVGAVIGLGMALLFTVGPILLIGWLVMKMLRGFSRGDELAV